jgi:acetyl-CoA C-acetyltransferase
VQAELAIDAILKYMRPVAVIGIGKTAFGAFPGRDLRSLAVEAIENSLADAHVQTPAVQAFYLGNFAGPSFSGQNHLAPYVGAAAGFRGIPCTRIEDACASSGSAFFHAWQSVAAGFYDLVVAAGVEKMTAQSTPRVTEILAGAGDMSGEGRAGATFPALFAMIARRHMHNFGTTREHLAAVAVKNHANGAKNPLAHMRKVITLEQALAGKPVAEPLTVYDCSLISDGAAAVVIVPAEQAARYTSRFARVLAVSQTSDYVPLDNKADITVFPSVQLAGEQAYTMAGLGPADIDVAELHDCFTIAEIVASEDLGFTEKGQGGPFAAAGCTSIGGRIPINTSGGLKAKGHPVGATGVGQICDIVMQLRGDAGERQVARHRIGLAQNLGGSGATCVVTILEAA